MRATIIEPGLASGIGETLFDRFEVLEELGSGGFGRVLRCRDRDTGEETAVKELHRFGADALLDFKKEFRALSDVQHPNLVRLGELLEREGRWAFTLEYVPGVDVLSWVRSDGEGPGFDERRLREALVQLVYGLMAIHGLGLLHRDVKPHNVRVTTEGRAVLLDFGLVMHLAHGRQASEASTMGTVAYMAPEQAAEVRLGPSADWYALGVLLYELLTGRLPFDGTSFNIMLCKQSELPPRPSSIHEGIPEDLDAICMGLLATKPADRLDGEAVLAWLSRSSGTSLIPPLSRTRHEEPFVGRSVELDVLRKRFQHAMVHGIQLALVEGESGIGKTATMEQFVARLTSTDPNVLVLRGRCHAAEQLGYKAFDGAIDELSRALKSLPNAECMALLPPDAHLLPVLFPVLSRAAPIAQAQRSTRVDRVERYPLFAAFVEFLLRLGKTRAVVITVDDLQWADEASLVLLRTLMDSRRVPRLFIVATVRPLALLDDSVGEGLRALSLHERASVHSVGPLDVEDTRVLAARLMSDAEDGRITKLLAAESGGHPLFVTELVRHAESLGMDGATAIDLDAAILQRVETLPSQARFSLELLCVVSGPVPQVVLRAALGASGDAVQSVLATLRAQKLIRTARRGEIVSYHDRMREVVLSAIDKDTLARHHRKLALAFQSQPKTEPAQVAQHWISCGEHERAVPWLERAAAKAEQGGAFERAAQHYQTLLALERAELSVDARHTTKLKLSEALASAGRCAESARELLEALDGASAHEAPGLAVRAAQRLLQAGKVGEGLSAARQAFELLDLPWPSSRARVVMRLAYNRARIALTDFDVPAARPDHVSETERTAIEAIKRLVLPMAWADFLRDAEMVGRHTLLALRIREPAHLAYALSSEACMRTLQGAPPAETEALFAKATSWQRRLRGSDVAELAGHEAYMRGTAAIFRGDFPEAERQLEAADTLYRTQCPGAVWELTNVRGVLLNVWSQRGKYTLLADCAQSWIDEAVARGDAFARATYVVAGFGANRHLMRDAPADHASEIEDAMLPWRSDSVGVQHFTETFAVAWRLAYVGGEGADAYWTSIWPRLSRSFLFRMSFMREGMYAARLLNLLARRCATGSEDASMRKLTRGCVRALWAPSSAVGMSFGSIVRAQVAFLEGDLTQARKLALATRTEAERMGTFFALPADVLLARAEGAADAASREQRALDWFEKGGWVRPDRALELILPVRRTWQ